MNSVYDNPWYIAIDHAIDELYELMSMDGPDNDTYLPKARRVVKRMKERQAALVEIYERKCTGKTLAEWQALDAERKHVQRLIDSAIKSFIKLSPFHQETQTLTRPNPRALLWSGAGVSMYYYDGKTDLPDIVIWPIKDAA